MMDRNLKARLETQNDPRMRGNERHSTRKTRGADRPDPRMPEKTERAAAGHPSELVEIFAQLETLQVESARHGEDIERLTERLDAVERATGRVFAAGGLSETVAHVKGEVSGMAQRLDSLCKSLGETSAGSVNRPPLPAGEKPTKSG